MQLQFTIEEWRPVVGWEGWYEVSNLGRVRRIRRAPGTQLYRLLVPSKNPASAYQTIHLWRNCQGKACAIHRLVLRAFVGPRPPGLIAHHKNADHTDNRLANLEYATQSYNILRAFEMGTKVPSGSHLRPRQDALKKLAQGT